MGLIDSHAHLTFPELAGQIEDVLARCDEADVDTIITIGTDAADARWVDPADLPEYNLWDETIRVIDLSAKAR